MAKVGVVLLNLGGPERIQDVGPFLYNLFADPEIIRLPNPALQKPLAWLISSLRAGKSQAAYRSIGGGSPLRRITEQQARELQSTLRQRGIEATSYVAMRYWHPFTESAVADIKADGIDEVVVLPLYPHFSISTSGSSFRELQRLRQGDPSFSKLPIRCIRSYYDDPGYIGAMAELIGKEIQACPNPADAHIFFSAHGVPKSYVEEAGDPYQKEIETCAQLIMEKLASDLGHPNPFTLAYQSRVGPVEWLKPYTDDALNELGESSVKDLVVVPISFVSEHIETLEESISSTARSQRKPVSPTSAAYRPWTPPHPLLMVWPTSSNTPWRAPRSTWTRPLPWRPRSSSIPRTSGPGAGTTAPRSGTDAWQCSASPLSCWSC
jgi:ferrochelatase